LRLREHEFEWRKRKHDIETERQARKDEEGAVRHKEEMKLREKELKGQFQKDAAERKRVESLAGQTRFKGEALRHSLPKMGNDTTEFHAYFRAVENLFTLCEVPSQLQSKLVVPMLNERSKNLSAKLSKERLDDYKQVRDYLLREFHLTAQQYRDKFWSATRQPDETYTLFGSRVKNFFLYYLDSRKVVSKDDVIDLFWQIGKANVER